MRFSPVRYPLALAALVACTLDERSVDTVTQPNVPSDRPAGGEERDSNAALLEVSVNSVSTGAAGKVGAQIEPIPADAGAAPPSVGADGGRGAGVSLRVSLLGDGFGQVSVSEPGKPPLLCARTCPLSVAPGSIVTVTATPSPYSIVQGWSIPACGSAGECSVRVDGLSDLGVEFRLAHAVVFMSSVQYLPQELPRVGAAANAECGRLAALAGVHGSHWVAWLSSQGPTDVVEDDVNAVDFFQHVGGWLSRDGQPVARSLAALLDGELLRPITWTETGGPATGVAWSATGLDGRATKQGAADCRSWSSADGSLLGATSGLGAVGDVWSGVFVQACDLRGSILCFGDDADAELPIVPAQGRLAFLSATDFAPSSGIAAADRICQREACEAGVSGGADCASAPNSGSSFLAYLQTRSVPAWQRFDLTGSTWVRPDGVQWLSSAAELQRDGTAQLTALNVTLGLRYTGGRFVWTGDALGAATCDDWSSSTARGSVSFRDLPNGPLSVGTMFDCAVPAPVYCLQN